MEQRYVSKFIFVIILNFIILLSKFNFCCFVIYVFIAKSKLQSVLQDTVNNYLPKLENVLKKLMRDIKSVSPETERKYGIMFFYIKI